MTRMRVLVPGIAALITVIVGFVMIVLVHSSDLSRMPWRPLGLVLVAIGAVGLMVSMVTRAVAIRGSMPPSVERAESEQGESGQGESAQAGSEQPGSGRSGNR
jgi:hypothetical protein